MIRISTRCGGGKSENKRVTQDVRVNMRVEVVKKNHKLAIRGLKNPVLTRIIQLATRLNPLKALQVVDFPDIEENKARAGARISGMRRDQEEDASL